MDKFKNLFTEEVEEEVKPIKKEVRQVEIPSPRRETRVVPTESTEAPISDNETIKKDEKFVFPLYFDDKDFDDLEKPKKVEKPVKKEPKLGAYQGNKVQTQVEKRFQASPIISPVYGVLDKNYKKEDIAVRPTDAMDYTRRSRKVTVDDIRNKAFGTLEDDLEDTLFGENSILFKEDIDEEPVLEEAEPIDIFEDLHFDEESEDLEAFKDEELLEEPVITDIEEIDDQESLGLEDDTVLLAKQLEDQKKKLEEINDYISDSVVEEETEIDASASDLTDSELLGLVDTMYEKRDEE